MTFKANISKKYYFIFTLYFLGFGVIVALITSFINYKSSFTDIEMALYDKAKSETEFKRNFLFNYISEVEALLSSVSINELTREYIKSDDIDNEQNLINLFYALTYANKNIMQLRYIDISGNEKIRIDRNNKTSELLIVPKDKMQNKKQRNYFQEILLLTANQFWHSNINLNIEHGKIEFPIKPTFRVATQLVVEDQLKGIIIVNLMFEDVLDILAYSENFNTYIVDKDGEVIHHPERSGSWSRYLDNIDNLYNIFPELVDGILDNEMYFENGLYSCTLGDLFKNAEHLKIILKPKSELMKKMQEKNITSAFLVALTVIVVSIPLSWLISIIPSRLQSELASAYQEISKNAEIIDNYVMISTTDKTGMIKSISNCFTKITGYTADEVVGKKHNILRHPDTPVELHKDLWETILAGKVWDGDLKNRDKNGRNLWIHEFITPEFNQSREITGFTSVAQDITDKKNIEKISITDSLTGLYNRHKLEEVLPLEMARFDRYKSHFSIIIFDVDFFKKVNDTYGHIIGDNVLINLAGILKENARETDIISRWGGEEFLIIAGGTEVDGAFYFADKLRNKVESYDFPAVGKITISCGVAQYTTGEVISDLISRADNALYEAKTSGRNRVIKG
ncbi:MAG: diguanylate cyclase [gamma proteobacterium symbiont of Bathyaustriella thionipta]|nr:diguanylate cyclase [gamma proteobacterium symbiont of Bathyaustriella thionipta]MCU7950889.1 diguanylate cyclase [gamma proteobacterium symbiont of Bathyaustriella thionipta]MCU7952337.1 diguanylate cyclase [gamma proteobacterium symbiont of Bathyaustriella thionipta]MCU7957383.1 diguanylate cyclase [gamma proteobacterium symbiont of Bathyaustriella thionipta]MCU7965653.1 diguanylate cyclase [gamma proteobacterium symbiont of Bathyaustriella thionipta]